MGDVQQAEDGKLSYQIEKLTKQVSELEEKGDIQRREIYLLQDENRKVNIENEKLLRILENISKAMAVGGTCK